MHITFQFSLPLNPHSNMDIYFAKNHCFMNDPQRPPRLATLGFTSFTVEQKNMQLLAMSLLRRNAPT